LIERFQFLSGPRDFVTYALFAAVGVSNQRVSCWVRRRQIKEWAIEPMHTM